MQQNQQIIIIITIVYMVMKVVYTADIDQHKPPMYPASVPVTTSTTTSLYYEFLASCPSLWVYLLVVTCSLVSSQAFHCTVTLL